jgi:hypothetical protein
VRPQGTILDTSRGQKREEPSMGIQNRMTSGDIVREGIRKAGAFPEGERVRITNGTTGKVRLATVQPHGNLTPVARCDDGSLVVLGLVLADLPWLWGQTTVEVSA